MLSGTADPGKLAEGAAVLASFDTQPVTLENVEMLQALCEIEAAASQALLPPALHPTNPPLVGWQIYRCPDSPWGAFQLAQSRIQCRCGVRPRAFLQSAVVDNDRAAQALRDHWGFKTQLGEIDFNVGYLEMRGSVRVAGDCILEIAVRDPQTLGPGDVQHIASMHLADTPRGLRLIQVETEHHISRAQRGEPLIDAFAPASWGDARVVPSRAVSACYVELELTLPRLRFGCRPDVVAFAGTESLLKPAA